MKAITIRVDNAGNIAIDFSKSLTPEEMLDVLGKVASIVYKYGREQDARKKTRLKNIKKLETLMAKQNPELN